MLSPPHPVKERNLSYIIQGSLRVCVALESGFVYWQVQSKLWRTAGIPLNVELHTDTSVQQ